jgi:hypothetical protein
MHVEGSRNFDDYLKIKKEADLPISQRSKIIKTNRGNYRIPRKYHNSPQKLTRLQAQIKSGNTPNPYRQGGIYYAFIQALINLGINKRHSFLEIKKEMRRIMSAQTDKKTKRDSWDLFKNKVPKNSLCAKDVNGRIIQNAYILQRLTGFDPYGEKLRELEMCIDIFKSSDDLPDFMLRTGAGSYMSIRPINEFKKIKKVPAQS